MVEAQERMVQLDEADMEFSEAIAKAGGEKINLCFQCGTCAASCPIARFNENYNPRLILRAAALGLTKRVLPSEVIWLCAACYSCTERCPRGVRPTEVICAIRNLAVKKGYVHPFYKMQAATIVNFGRAFKEDERVDFNVMRGDMNLPPIGPIKLEELTKFLRFTNVKGLLSVEKGEDAR